MRFVIGRTGDIEQYVITVGIFGKKHDIQVFIADDADLPEPLMVWLEKADFKPHAETCVWRFLQTQLKTDPIDASAFAIHDGIIDMPVMRADPVCIKPDWHGLNVVDNQPILTQQEAENLCGEITQDIQTYTKGYTLHCPSPNRWYITGEKIPSFPSEPTACIQGAYTHQAQDLPDEWVQVLNHVQISLYQHPINLHRRAQNQAEVNSLWFWGVSNKAKKPSKIAKRKHPQTLFSDNEEIWIFAQSIGMACKQITDFMPNDGTVLILNDGVACETLTDVLPYLNHRMQVYYRGAIYN